MPNHGRDEPTPRVICCPVKSDINRARTELLRRLEAHPPSSWPTNLLAAVAAVIDLRFTEISHHGIIQPTGKPRLRVIR